MRMGRVVVAETPVVPLAEPAVITQMAYRTEDEPGGATGNWQNVACLIRDSYIAHKDSSGGIYIRDLSNPAHPVTVNHINYGTDYDGGLYVTEDGNYLVYAGYHSFHAWDVTDLESIDSTPIASYSLAGGVDFRYATGVVVGDHLILPSQYLGPGIDALHIFDLSALADGELELISDKSFPTVLGGAEQYAWVTKISDTIVAAASMDVTSGQGVGTIDISNPEDPQLLDVLPLTYITAIEYVGDGRVAVGYNTNQNAWNDNEPVVGNVGIIDVSDPTDISLEGFTRDYRFFGVTSFTTYGDYLVVFCPGGTIDQDSPYTGYNSYAGIVSFCEYGFANFINFVEVVGHGNLTGNHPASLIAHEQGGWIYAGSDNRSGACIIGVNTLGARYDNLAWGAGGVGGLTIRDPQQFAAGVAVDGNTMITTHDQRYGIPRIVKWNITTRSAPTYVNWTTTLWDPVAEHVNEYEMMGYPGEVAVRAGKAVTLDTNRQGLFVFDVSTSWPVFGSSIFVAGSASEGKVAFIDDNTVVTSSDERITTFDVTDPYNVTQLDQYHNASVINNARSTLVVNGNWVHTVGQSDRYIALDVTDPADIQHLSNYGSASFTDYGRGIVVYSGNVYILSSDDQQVTRFSMNVVNGSIIPDGTSSIMGLGSGILWGMLEYGGYLWCTKYNFAEGSVLIRIGDLASSPMTKTEYSLSTDLDDRVNGFAITSDGWLYAVMDASGSLIVRNLNVDPGVDVTKLTKPLDWDASQCAITDLNSGGVIISNTSIVGMSFYGESNPFFHGQTTYAPAIPIWSPTRAVFNPLSSYVYAFSSSGEVCIFHVPSVSTRTYIGQWHIPGFPSNVNVGTDNMALLVGTNLIAIGDYSNEMIHFISVATAASPTVVSSVDSRYALDGAKHPTLPILYVGDYYNGLRTFDISTPSTPILTSEYTPTDHPDFVQRAQMVLIPRDTNKIIVGDNYWLSRFDISEDPYNPVFEVAEPESPNWSAEMGNMHVQISGSGMLLTGAYYANEAYLVDPESFPPTIVNHRRFQYTTGDCRIYITESSGIESACMVGSNWACGQVPMEEEYLA